MTYKQKAKKLIESGFRVAGYGHFNITQDELAIILELIEKEKFDQVAKLYKKLEKERL